MQTPVLLIVSNPPDLTARVLESIRQVAPPRLYIAGGAIRAPVSGQTVAVHGGRNAATAVDWPCDVVTKLSDAPLDHKHVVISALNWFFATESEGIVLEDNCLPHPDFFHYCEWALNRYRDDPRVFHVNGSNLSAPPRIWRGRPIAFTPLAQVSGWASWADRWRFFESNPFYLDTSEFRGWPVSLAARWHKRHHAELLRQGLDAWGHHWQIAILKNGGLCVTSRANLITGIRTAETATCMKPAAGTRPPSELFDNDGAPIVPEANKALTRWFERKMGLASRLRLAQLIFERIMSSLDSRLERVAARILFGRARPIVVASSGRAGSTLLFRAIVDGMIVRRFGKSLPKRIPPRIYTYISKRAGAFVARLRDIDQNPHRVQKTHDLYDARYSGKAKFIFIYGDPLEAALSAANMVEKRGVIWLQEHMYHLSTKGEFDDLFRRDLLNFGEQVRTWSQSDPKDVLILSFDELWDAVPAISAFVGLQITLPARQPRAAKPTIEDIDTRTFAQLLDDAKSTVAAREHQEQAK